MGVREKCSENTVVWKTVASVAKAHIHLGLLVFKAGGPCDLGRPCARPGWESPPRSHQDGSGVLWTLEVAAEEATSEV